MNEQIVMYGILLPMALLAWGGIAFAVFSIVRLLLNSAADRRSQRRHDEYMARHKTTPAG